MKRVTKKIVKEKFSDTVKQVRTILKESEKAKDKVSRNKSLSDFERKATISEIEGDTKLKVSDLTHSFSKTRKKLKSADYDNFNFSSLHVTTNTYQETFRAKRGYSKKDLDNAIPDILSQSDVSGVLVIFRVESEETGQKQYVSNYITSEVYERIKENGQTVFEYVSERLQAGNTKDYNLKFIYLKVIHENTKSIKSKS